jgi:hypothetical protein
MLSMKRCPSRTGIAFFLLLSAWAGAVLAGERPTRPEEVYGVGSKLQPTLEQPTPEQPAPDLQPPRITATRLSPATVDSVRYWNQVAIDASGVDHTPVLPGESRVYGEQLGPGRAARAMAIVHIAMFDSANAILRGYRSYTGLRPLQDPASVDAALAAAAHDTLVAMFPSQASAFGELYRTELRRLAKFQKQTHRDRGVALGKRAAATILALREHDGSHKADPLMAGEWPTSDQPYHWRQDPIALAPIALGAYWGEVKPFVLQSATQFRTPPPPAMNSPEYTAAFNEVKALGGDGVHTQTQRTEEQTQIGIFWAYDGMPSLCAPPRLYNQVASEISRDMTNVMELLRLYALLNVSMADAGIASWESKFHYDVWRPVTGIREANEGKGPTGLGDGNPDTDGDSDFWPLGAPASNLNGSDFTPPFPSYPSGHATFGGAVFQTLRKIYRTDKVAFTFVSDEMNGETIGRGGEVRPLVPRSFETLSQAEEENGQSRIYLGIHWSFDKTAGIAQGRQVADYVYANAFQRVR